MLCLLSDANYDDVCPVSLAAPSVVSLFVVFLLLFYVLATSLVISARIPTYDSTYSWRFYRLGNQAASTMTQFPTQSYYSDTEPTSPYPILIMPIT